MWNFAVDEIHDMMWNQKCNRLRHEGYSPDLLQIFNLINISPGVFCLQQLRGVQNLTIYPYFHGINENVGFGRTGP